MAINNSTLADEDGNYSDWIELRNTTALPVSLEGWHLSDDADELAKWTFPATSLTANAFLVVFASGKDRAAAGAELHTNFKLAGDGEYLALVEPDGVTIAHEFSPAYPPQQSDESYGYTMDYTNAVPLVAEGAGGRVLVPADGSLGTNWTLCAFDDGDWPAGPTAVGFDVAGDYDDIIATDLQSAMQGVNQGCYLRIPFVVDDPAAFNWLLLDMKYDDGFAARVNGRKVAAANTPEPLNWDSAATQEHDDAAAVEFERFAVPLAGGVLAAGTNVLAIHGLNLTSNPRIDDFLILPELTGVNSTLVARRLLVPTPGAPNDPSAGQVVFSPRGGAFSGSIDVALSVATGDASIRYTLDGKEPTEISALYDGPIHITAGVRIRARAFAPGLLAGPTAGESYIALAADVRDFTSPLPVVIFDNFGAGEIPNKLKGHTAASDGSGVTQAVRQAASMLLFGRRDDGRSCVTNAADLAARCGVRVRGGSSALDNVQPVGKKNLSVESWSEKDETPLDISPLGLPEESDWVLYTPYTFDRALVRNTFVYELFTRMGNYAVRTRFVELFYNTDGGQVSMADYGGLYVLMEEVKRDADRVDFEELSPEGTQGGWMTRTDRMDPIPVGGSAADIINFHTRGPNRIKEGPPYGRDQGGDDIPVGYNNFINFVSPRGYDATPAQTNAIVRAYDDFETALYGAQFADPATGYAAYVDVDGFVDRLLLDDFVGGPDALALSTFMVKRSPSDPLEFGPPWDYDRTMDSYDGRDDNYSTHYVMGRLWFPRFYQDPDFRQKFIDRLQQLRNGTLSTAAMDEIIDAQAAEITGEVAARNFAYWGGDANSPREGSWAAEVTHLKGWLQNRGQWYDGQYVPMPTFGQDGGPVPEGFEVTIAAANGTVYFTTNGVDPRAPGGAVAGDAVQGASVTLTGNTIVRARARQPSWTDSLGNSAPWSGLAEAVFVVAPPELAVTEVMYHPREPAGVETNGGYLPSDYEFIEIRNTGAAPTPLVGVRFADGIQFDFTWGAVDSLGPGEYAVAVNNLAAFTNRYPGWSGMKIAGEYEGNLNDGGERVMLQGPLGETIVIFTYGDGRIWPQSTDGVGHSLVPLVLDDQIDGRLDYWGNWRASAFIDGSPGAVDPEPAASVVINEVGAHTDTGLAPPYDSDDWIELYNPLGTEVDVGGWYLSDNGDDLKRYRISDGTVIEAGGFLLLTENLDFHTNRLDGSGFGLNKAGESVFLSCLPGTAEGRVVDAVRFKGQENGVSLGRYPDAGQYWYALSPTPDAANVPPGPHVYISGIMYNPLRAGTNAANNTRDEYIEISNPLGTAVELWTDAGPWRIDGGISCTFPPGTTLAAGESLYLVSFDPGDSEALSGFLAAYGFTNGQVRLFGPYAGLLANEGERVALERPQAPDLPLEGVSWVIVDEAVYFGRAPWPVDEDGVGRGIERVDAAGSGNDPGNWTAPEPSLLLALHWKLDETSGTLAEDSGWYGSHGTLRDILPGNADGNTPPLWTPGKLGNALEFDGVDDVVRFDGKVANAFPFTVTAWVKTSSGTGIRCAVYIGESGNDYRYYCIGVNGGKGEIAGHVSDNPRARLSARGSTTVADGSWHHLAGVFRTPTEKLLYVDGVPEAVLTTELVYTDTVDRCSAGLCDRPSADGAWLGELDDVRVYNAELTEDGIHNLAEEVPETADEDGDGLPDAWERQYFGSTNAPYGGPLDDWDLDGMSNEGEYAAGTDPTNALSVFRVLIGASKGLPVVWFATLEAEGEGYQWLERYYDLEHRTNLIEGGWTGLVPYVDILGTGAPVILTNEAPAVHTFYRGKVRLQPGGP